MRKPIVSAQAQSVDALSVLQEAVLTHRQRDNQGSLQIDRKFSLIGYYEFGRHEIFLTRLRPLQSHELFYTFNILGVKSTTSSRLPE